MTTHPPSITDAVRLAAWLSSRPALDPLVKSVSVRFEPTTDAELAAVLELVDRDLYRVPEVSVVVAYLNEDTKAPEARRGRILIDHHQIADGDVGRLLTEFDLTVAPLSEGLL